METMSAGMGQAPVARYQYRVIWNPAGDEVAVSVLRGDGSSLASCRQHVEIIEAFVDQAREGIHEASTTLATVEAVRDSRSAVAMAIAAISQVAAAHAGIPMWAAKIIGNIAGKLGRRLLGDSPDRGESDSVARYLDFGCDVQSQEPGPGEPGVTVRPEEPEVTRFPGPSPEHSVRALIASHARDVGMPSGGPMLTRPGGNQARQRAPRPAKPPASIAGRLPSRVRERQPPEPPRSAPYRTQETPPGQGPPSPGRS